MGNCRVCGDFGSQVRECLACYGGRLIAKGKVGDQMHAIVEESEADGRGWLLFVANDHHAGYTLDINGVGYEMASGKWKWAVDYLEWSDEKLLDEVHLGMHDNK